MRYSRRRVAARAIALLLCCILWQGVFALPVYAEGESGAGEDIPAYYTPDFEQAAPGVMVVNVDTGFPIYEKNADQPFVAASLVKLMTAIIVREQIQDIDAITVTADTWVFNAIYGLNASHADIYQGETLTVRELLYALLLPSANEAALMLAWGASGGYLPNFYYLMNQKAKELGCTGTVFVDPNGLSEDNLSTARDMALIMQEFYKDPLLVEISGTPVYEMAAHNHKEPYYIHNTNKLLSPADLYAQAYASVTGTVKAGKTGRLGEWESLASVAEKNGVTYCVVALHSPDGADTVAIEYNLPSYKPAQVESARLYDWAYKSFVLQTALDTSAPIYEVPVKYSTERASVHLLPASSLRALLPKGVDTSLIEKTFTLPEYLPAPVEEGDVVGSVSLSIQGKPLGEVPLLAAQGAKRNVVWFMLQKVGEFFTSTFFRVFLVLALVLGMLYMALMIRYNRKKQLRRQARRAAQQRAGQRQARGAGGTARGVPDKE